MAKFTKKPDIYEAFKYRTDPIPDWEGVKFTEFIDKAAPTHVEVVVGDLKFRANPGDHVTKSPNGDICVYSKEDFPTFFEIFVEEVKDV